MKIINYKDTITGIDNEVLKNEYENGLSCESLAKKYQCHSATIFYKLKKIGCVPVREIIYGDKANSIRCMLKIHIRDKKRFKLTGKCSYCLSTKGVTIRHHKYYSVKGYDPNAIIEVCESCHAVLHNSINGKISMPIIN